ncbi:MAG: TauD/TfdA family dioxygenase [Chloroflexia bacterium]
MSALKTSVHREPISGPSAWLPGDLESSANWRYSWKPETLSEIEQAVRQWRSGPKGVLDTILRQPEQARETFPLTSFTDDAHAIKEELEKGHGFVLLKGLPLDSYTVEEAYAIYAGISVLFGMPLAQDREGNLFYSVRDEGFQIESHGTPGVRGTKSNARLHFHTDSAPAHRGNTPDIVGLLCLHQARAGGESLLVNANTLHNIILREEPSALQRLYESYYFDRRADAEPWESPLLEAPVFMYDGILSMRFNEFYMIMGAELAGVPMLRTDLAAISVIKRLTNRPELIFRFTMERGDIQFLNNHYVIHARSAFEDRSGPEEKRHLVRIWLKLSNKESA